MKISVFSNQVQSSVVLSMEEHVAFYSSHSAYVHRLKNTGKTPGLAAAFRMIELFG